MQVPVNEPLLDGNEAAYLAECVRTGWISSEGPFLRRFEEAVAARCGRAHGIAVSNGSTALDAAVLALGIGPGDEVVMPSFTIISCASAVVRAGATPVFVDSDPVTWTMDPRALDAVLTSKTRAIMPVHTYGLAVDMAPVLAFADRHGLRVIEDAAEALGSSCAGRPCGGFGDISTLSFYANKHVTCGEGGMILTDDASLAARCRSLRNLCFQPERRFVHDELGFNFRMTNLQAAIGLAQVERLDGFLAKKQRMGARYRDAFADLTDVAVAPASTPYTVNDYWVFGLVLGDSKPFDASHAMRELASRGVGTRPFFFPMHEQPVFTREPWLTPQSLPVAERLARRGFYVPSGLALTDAQQDHVIQQVREVLR